MPKSIHFAAVNGRIDDLRDRLNHDHDINKIFSSLNQYQREEIIKHRREERQVSRTEQDSFFIGFKMTSLAIMLAILAYNEDDVELRLHAALTSLSAGIIGVFFSLMAFPAVLRNIKAHMDTLYANPDYDISHWTPLCFAVVSGNIESIQLLLLAGADTRALIDENKRDFSDLVDYYTGFLGKLSKQDSENVLTTLSQALCYERRARYIRDRLANQSLVELSIEPQFAFYLRAQKQVFINAIQNNLSLVKLHLPNDFNHEDSLHARNHITNNIKRNACIKLEKFFIFATLLIRHTPHLPVELSTFIFSMFLVVQSLEEMQLQDHLFFILNRPDLKRLALERFPRVAQQQPLRNNSTYQCLAKNNSLLLNKFGKWKIPLMTTVSTPDEEPAYQCLHDAAFHNDIRSIEILLRRGHPIDEAYLYQQVNSTLQASDYDCLRGPEAFSVTSIFYSAITAAPSIAAELTDYMIRGDKALVSSVDINTEAKRLKQQKEQEQTDKKALQINAANRSSLYKYWFSNSYSQTHLWPPLFFAARSNAVEAARLLIRSGANYCLWIAGAENHISIARSNGNLDVMEAMRDEISKLRKFGGPYVRTDEYDDSVGWQYVT